MKIFSIETLKSKRVRYGGYAAVVTALTVAGLILINLLAANIPLDIDLTENKVFSLSDATIQLAESLEEPVHLYALYKTGERDEDVMKILEKYERLSEGIDLTVIDPELQPGFVNQYTEPGTSVPNGSVIVESGKSFRVLPATELYSIHYNQQGQGKVIGFAMEQKISAAIQYAASGYTPKIYVLSGHGEESLDSMGLTGVIEEENYEVEKLNLLTQPDMPEDASVLIILSPKYDLTEKEVDTIYEWLQNGGRGIFLFDLIRDDVPMFNDLLASYGLKVNQGLIMDPDQQRHVGTIVYLLPQMAEHQLLEPLSEEDLYVITPGAISISEIARKPRNIELSPLFTTSPSSFARTDYSNRQETQSPQDIPGPFTVGWAVEKQKETLDDDINFRLVVMGNSRFLAPIQPYGRIKGNIEFFLNSLSWVNERDETITIRSKSLLKLPMQMNAFVMYLYTFIILVVIPVGILITGLVIWLRRRHL